MNEIVHIWTDGASDGTSSCPGGHAAILRFGKQERVVVGGDSQTTHQRMELLAAIAALEALPRPEQVVLTTDSAYVADCFVLGWWKRWLTNGWRNSSGKPVANRDLWERLLAQNERHQIDWRRVRGHSEDVMNNRCDQLAVTQKLAVRLRAA